jgi:hypothetical protein
MNGQIGLPRKVCQIPGSMHQPCDSDEPVRWESRVDDWRGQKRVDQFRDAKSSVEVGTAGSGNKNRVEVSARGFRYVRPYRVFHVDLQDRGWRLTSQARECRPNVQPAQVGAR